jgi:putative transposase
LFVFVVLAHHRRRIVHFNVTEHPTAGWTGQQMVEAFPEDRAPRYLLRDRDKIYGYEFRERMQSMSIEEVLSAPASPWQRAYVERLIGSFVVHNKRSVLWRSPLCGAEPGAPPQTLVPLRLCTT